MSFGFVLVGGRSSRMGRDKSLLPYRGRPMALHQAAKLAFVCGRAALVGKDPRPFVGTSYPFVTDGAEPHASAFGVLAALSWSPVDLNLIVAADLPRCPEAFLAALLAAAEEAPAAPAVVPVVGGHVQTLCAAWRRSALLPLTKRVADGDYSLRDVLTSMGALLVPEIEIATWPGGSPESFFNVNTPEEYESLGDETQPYAPRR
jgi:molybdopterin-guanine dinucleotide biosynthesis protein A